MKQRYSKLKSVALAALTMGLALGVQAANYLTFTAQEANSSVTFNWKSADSVHYSTNGGTTWNTYTAGTKISLQNVGDKVMFKGKNVITAYKKGFSMSGKIAASGDVTSLTNEIGGDTTLVSNCYQSMFRDCTSLTTAPALPATTLATSCYISMFRGCTSLTSAPTLPTTTTTAPRSCYASMFYGCTSLTNAPALSAMTLADHCYESMFRDCTSLTTAPTLPATTLAELCYQSMFNGCTSLIDIPALDVAVVTNECCNYMFKNCSNLVVNTTGPGKEWKIPSTVTIPDTAAYGGATYWASRMFEKTSGTVKEGAQIMPGQTYYVGAKKETVGDVTLFSYGGQTRVDVAGELTRTVADSIKDQGITNLVIGAGVTSVGDGAFLNWKSLREVTVGADCETIGMNAFSKCYNLSNVTCQATKLSLGDYAFLRCNALQSLSFAAMPSNYDDAKMPFAFHAEIEMRDGMPKVFAVPQVTIGGYNQVLRGSNNLVDWEDVTTEQQRAANHFFKIVLRAK